MTRTEELMKLADAAIHERNNLATLELGDISHYELFEATATPETIKQLVELAVLQNQVITCISGATAPILTQQMRQQALVAFKRFEQGGK